MKLPLSVRRVTSVVLERIPVRIRRGPNAGARWSLPVAGRHRKGTFEIEHVATVAAFIEPGACVWDIGAHHGYLTVMASRMVGAQGLVCSFEPSPLNFRFLQRHVRWDGRGNVLLFNTAVAAAPGVVAFGGSGSTQTFRIGGGKLRVQATSLEHLMRTLPRAPDVLKLDTEGAEGDILESGARHLPPAAVVVVSVHSSDAYRRSAAALVAQGFRIFASADVRRYRDLADWGDDDPDIVAIGPARDDLLARAEALPGFMID